MGYCNDPIDLENEIPTVVGITNNELPFPRSYFNAIEKEIEEEISEGVEVYPNVHHFESVSDIFEYYYEFTPHELWYEFSLYLAKVADYLLERDGEINVTCYT